MYRQPARVTTTCWLIIHAHAPATRRTGHHLFQLLTCGTRTASRLLGTWHRSHAQVTTWFHFLIMYLGSLTHRSPLHTKTAWASLELSLLSVEAIIHPRQEDGANLLRRALACHNPAPSPWQILSVVQLQPKPIAMQSMRYTMVRTHSQWPSRVWQTSKAPHKMSAWPEPSQGQGAPSLMQALAISLFPTQLRILSPAPPTILHWLEPTSTPMYVSHLYIVPSISLHTCIYMIVCVCVCVCEQIRVKAMKC
jgi:hypothetical protein